jgi:hypothetical protein
MIFRVSIVLWALLAEAGVGLAFLELFRPRSFWMKIFCFIAAMPITAFATWGLWFFIATFLSPFI